MSYPNYKFILTFILIALAVGLLALAAPTPPAAYAGAGLPPRDAPAPPSPGGDHDKSGSPVGAYIELVAPDAPGGTWTVVQWQDSAGGWHDVEGWREAAAGSSRWWVHPKDFGTGPFRWVVTTGPDGPQWTASASFNLPIQPNEMLQVGVSPNP